MNYGVKVLKNNTFYALYILEGSCAYAQDCPLISNHDLNYVMKNDTKENSNGTREGMMNAKKNRKENISVPLIAGVVDMPTLNNVRAYTHIMSAAALRYTGADGENRLELLYVYGEHSLRKACAHQPDKKPLPVHSEIGTKMFSFKSFNRFQPVQPVVFNLQRIYREDSEEPRFVMRVGIITAMKDGSYKVQSEIVKDVEDYEFNVYKVRNPRMLETLNAFCKTDMWKPVSYLVRNEEGKLIESDHPEITREEMEAVLLNEVSKALDKLEQEAANKASGALENEPEPVQGTDAALSEASAPVERSGVVLDARTLQLVNNALYRYGLTCTFDKLGNRVTVHKLVRRRDTVSRSEEQAQASDVQMPDDTAGLGTVGDHLGSVLDRAAVVG